MPFNYNQLAIDFKKAKEHKKKVSLNKQPKLTYDDSSAAYNTIYPFEDFPVFTSQGIGLRKTQDDRIIIFKIDEHFNNSALTEEKIGKCLYETTLQLAKEVRENVGEANSMAGSTLNFSLQINNKLFTVNVGDSRAILMQEKKGQYQATPLNWPHLCSDPDEQNLIIQAGGNVTREYGALRLDGSLMVSRAIGDYYLDDKGLSYEPSITVVSLGKINKNDFIINCSDGFTDVLSEYDIEKIFNSIETHDDNLMAAENPANFLRKQAYIRKSTDNTSVIITPICEHSHKPSSESPKVMIISAIADGHGGSLVADYIKENLYRILIEQCKKFELINNKRPNDDNSSDEKSKRQKLHNGMFAKSTELDDTVCIDPDDIPESDVFVPQKKS